MTFVYKHPPGGSRRGRRSHQPFERDKMRLSTITLGGLLLAASASSAFAQDTAPPKPITVTGNVTLTSDYRFRGITQSDGDGAAQATVNVNSSTGLYVGTFVSTIDDKVRSEE